MIEDEISLKEILLILIKGWKIVLSTSVVAVLIAVIIVTLFNDSTYSATMTGSINKIDMYQTKYGNFSSNNVTIEDQVKLVDSYEYSNLLSKVDDQNFVITSKIIDPSDFTLQIDSDNQATVEQIAQEFLESYPSYLNYDLQTKVISYFLSINDMNLNNALATSTKNESLINAFKNKLKESDVLISSGIINPAYQIILEEITKLELEEISNQNQILFFQNSKQELEKLIYDDFDSYLKADDHIEGVNVSLLFSKDIHYSSKKRFAPLLMVTIALILGLMLGTFIVLFKKYWENS